jgi:hypothetical protein
MNRLLAFVVYLFVSLGANALTVTPLPGSAPQTTRASAFFPQTVGVIVRDDEGVPIAGAEVWFSFDMSGPDAPFLMFLDEGGGIATTNTDGIATVPVAAGQVFGVVNLIAYSGETASVSMPFTIQGDPAVELRVISGDGQVAEPMQAFARPWVVRAIDAAGRPVPYAVVMFDGQADPGQPAGMFDGLDSVAVMADERGFARSPVPRANEILGHGTAYACGFGTGCPPFQFKIVPPAATAASIRPLPGSTPQTTCIACFFPNPVGVIVRDHEGRPMPGVPVTFSIPGLDGVVAIDLNSSRLFTMETNGDGIAAPRLMALATGKATVTVTTPIALGDAVFNLKIKERGPTRFEIVSGDGQSAAVFSDYAQPWIVRAVDRHGRTVPHAAVLFGVPDLSDFPGGRFGDTGVVVVAANEAGIATSPRLTANGVMGSNIGSAQSFGNDVFVQFHFRNLAP